MAQYSLRRLPWCRSGSRGRLFVAGHYLALATTLNLLWELGQLPLYAIWASAPLSESLFAAAHCTVGDLVIAASTLAVAALLVGRHWPIKNYMKTAVCALALGVAYTIFSEWLNVDVRGTWAYAPSMPRLPWIGTGLAPLAQWFVVPTVSFLILHRSARLG